MSGCQVMLNRYKWRHDSILKCLAELAKVAHPECEVMVDIGPNYVFPPEISVTAQRPDLLIIGQRESDDPL